MKPKTILWCVGVGLMSILSSCQVGHELHFFKAGDNYYRLKVNESSFASKARYVSGYYDEKAVDKYFSEMSQPKEGTAKPADSVSFMTFCADGVLQSQANRQLVMILSTNSDAITEQIGSFAENEQMLDAIARLANRDKVNESNKYKQDITNQHDRNQSNIALGDIAIAGLDDSASVASVKANLNLYLRNLKARKDEGVHVEGAEILIHEFEKP